MSNDAGMSNGSPCLSGSAAPGERCEMNISLLGHDGVGGSHMGGQSVWMVISLIVFSIFLLVFAWSLVRTSKPSRSIAADIATERYAQGEIDADDFQRILSDIESRRRR